VSDPEQIASVLTRVEQEIAKLRSDLPETLKLKEAEIAAEHRRLAGRPNDASTLSAKRSTRSAAAARRSSAHRPSSGSRTG
jgi:hypothetical protein